MGQKDHRASLRAKLALRLDCPDLDHALDTFDALLHDLNHVHARAKHIDVAFDFKLCRELAIAHAKDNANHYLPDRAYRKLHNYLYIVRDWTEDWELDLALANAMTNTIKLSHLSYVFGPRPDRGLEGWILRRLARLLPACERYRFVVEAVGNLGACEHWRQRVDQLAGLVVGMPRLALMLHDQYRRDRAR